MAVAFRCSKSGKLQARLDDLIATKGEPPWSETMMIYDDMQAFFIANPPGHPTDTHYHHHDEWWIVYEAARSTGGSKGTMARSMRRPGTL